MALRTLMNVNHFSVFNVNNTVVKIKTGDAGNPGFPWISLLYIKAQICFMAPHMKKLTNTDTHSLFDEGWNVLGFMAKYLVCWVKTLWTWNSGACFKFGSIWNANLFTFWLCLLHLPFLPVVLARFSYQNKSVCVSQINGKWVLTSGWVLSFFTVCVWTGTNCQRWKATRLMVTP